MDTHTVLVRARNLIDTPEKWSPRGWGDAGTRCLVHALCDVRGVEGAGDVAIFPEYKLLRRLVGGAYPGDWNDTHSHAEVLALVAEAIASTVPEPDTSFLNNVAEPVAA